MNTTDDSLDDPHSMKIAEIVETVLLAFICVVGTGGNLLVVAAVVTTRALQVRQNVFIFVLAFTDLVTAAILTPLFMLCLVRGEWPFGENSCIFIGYTTILCLTTSALTVNCIALCRYVTVAYTNPARRKRMHGRVVMLASVLLVVIAVTAIVLPIVGFGDVGFNQNLGHCSLRYENQFEWYYSAMMILLGFFAAFTIIPVTYTLIFCIVRKSRMSVESMTLASRVEPSSSEGHQDANRMSVKAKPPPVRNMTRDEVKLSKKLMLLFGVFIMCWIPYTSVILSDWNLSVPQRVHRATNFLVWINPCLNPFLYAWMIQTYRRAYRRLLTGMFCRKQYQFA